MQKILSVGEFFPTLPWVPFWTDFIDKLNLLNFNSFSITRLILGLDVFLAFFSVFLHLYENLRELEAS